MNSVQKKVLLDLFVHPLTMIPAALGSTLLLFGWAIGGGPKLTFLGLAAIALGVGIFLTKFFLGLDKLMQKASEYFDQQSQEEKTKKLDELGEMLAEDGDSRTDSALNDLRALYATYQKGIASGEITNATRVVIGTQIEDLFVACINQLQYANELYLNKRDVSGSGKVRKLIRQKREKVITEVLVTIDQLEKAVQQCVESTTTNTQNELSQRRKELERSLTVAATTEAKMRDLDKIAEK
jgi:mevalonate kinase